MGVEELRKQPPLKAEGAEGWGLGVVPSCGKQRTLMPIQQARALRPQKTKRHLSPKPLVTTSHNNVKGGWN